MQPKKKSSITSRVLPVGEMVLIYHDEDQKETAGGIILPDRAKVPVLTGRIIAIPDKLKEDKVEYPFEELDRVIYDPRCAIPVELLSHNRHFLVESKYIYAVIEDQSKDD